MSRYDVEAAIHRLRELGVNTASLHQDYYKIPLENIDLSKIERETPKNTKVTSKHTVIVDSRQRDYSIYPYPHDYLVNLMEPHRNVERIELIAAMMPKTEYNVSTENNLLLVILNGVTHQCVLTEGQYLIGSNVIGSVNSIADGSNNYTFGFIAELIRVLKNIHPDFNAFLATLPPGSGGTGQYASVLNRLVITNSSTAFSIDFTNQDYSSGSPFRIMGFNKQIYNASQDIFIYGSDDTGTCTSQTLYDGSNYKLSVYAINSIYDYNLKDDPKYIIMQLDFGNKSAERTESSDIATNQKFAIIIYDANDPDNIETFNSSTNPQDPVKIKIERKVGTLKALKGSDFDKKILTFEPPITLENFKVKFFKYDNTPYNFHNREHLLTFELEVADYDPKYRY